jgi:hypothetical protein
VRRQLARPFRRSREREEAVIRERYSIYVALPASKVETMRPLEEVVEKIASRERSNKGVQLTKGAREVRTEASSWRARVFVGAPFAAAPQC